jgi:glutathione S-transferase
MLRLHHAPMACSLASRFALQISGLPHEVEVVRTWRGENKADAYLRINPRGQVPALEVDEGVLTESTAILPYIADLAPEKQLFPPCGTFERAQGQAWLSFLSSTLHAAMAGVMFAPEGSETRAAATARLVIALQDVDRRLADRDHLLSTFSVCDLYLLVFSLWRAGPALAGNLPELPNLDRFQQSLFQAHPALMAIVAGDMQIRSEAL